MKRALENESMNNRVEGDGAALVAAALGSNAIAPPGREKHKGAGVLAAAALANNRNPTIAAAGPAAAAPSGREKLQKFNKCHRCSAQR